MSQIKKPEIQLEISSGSFKIGTEEVICNINVIPAPGGRQQPSQNTAADNSNDLYFETIAEDFMTAVESCVAEGATASDKLLTAATGESSSNTNAGNNAAVLAKKIQAKIVDLRFSLTFMKNHAALKEREKGKEEEITITPEDHDRIVAKVKSAIKVAQEISDAVNELRDCVGPSDSAEDKDFPAATELLKAAFILGSQIEQKGSDPEITADQSKSKAKDILDTASGSAAETSSGGIGNGSSEDSAGGEGIEEMSDEEALKKLEEFGL